MHASQAGAARVWLGNIMLSLNVDSARSARSARYVRSVQVPYDPLALINSTGNIYNDDGGATPEVRMGPPRIPARLHPRRCLSACNNPTLAPYYDMTLTMM